MPYQQGGTTPLRPKIRGNDGVQSVHNDAPQRRYNRHSGTNLIPFGTFVTQIADGTLIESPNQPALVYGITGEGSDTRGSSGPYGTTRWVGLPGTDYADDDTTPDYPTDRLTDNEEFVISSVVPTALDMEGDSCDLYKSGDGFWYANPRLTANNALYIKKLIDPPGQSAGGGPNGGQRLLAKINRTAQQG